MTLVKSHNLSAPKFTDRKMLTRKCLTQEMVRMQCLTEYMAHGQCSRDASEPWLGANSSQQTSSSD